jgi:hypothetical protein
MAGLSVEDTAINQNLANFRQVSDLESNRESTSAQIVMVPIGDSAECNASHLQPTQAACALDAVSLYGFKIT